MSVSEANQHVQASFDELGRPLADATFCVVDLETTGGSAAKGAMITEIGAVKVRGGQVLEEFSTLVNPGVPIPGFITVLTGITNDMVADAPDVESVLPSFLQFAHACVLVAHNAPFDIGFLKHFARRQQINWPAFEVLDTVRLSRRALHRDEAPNCKLATLAQLFGTPTQPSHRALDDARATTDVLHGLFERLGNLGVATLEDVSTFTSRISTEQRKKRKLADHLPPAAGVYIFRDRNDDVLYVGASVNIRSRARSYFTSSETRSRMGEMVTLAHRIDGLECATALEAQVRELRLIAQHKPPYNRRSRNPDKVVWLKLTSEPWPRLSIVRQIRDDAADYIGPFRGRRDAEDASIAIHDAFRIRECHLRLSKTPHESPCALAQMDRCLSPCDGSVSSADYANETRRVKEAMTGDPAELVHAINTRMTDLAAAQNYEQAKTWRDRLHAALRASARAERLYQLTSNPELIAAAPHDHGWQVHVFRWGRLAAAGVMAPASDAHGWVESLRRSAETVPQGFGPAPAAATEETECALRWLESPGVRIVRGSWHCRATGAAAHLPRLDDAVADSTDMNV